MSLNKQVTIPRQGAVMFIYDLLSGTMKVTRSSIVAEPLPRFQNSVEAGRCKFVDGGEATEESSVIWEHCPHLGLLEHHYGDPDSVGILLMPPRKVGQVRGCPGHEPGCKGPAFLV